MVMFFLYYHTMILRMYAGKWGHGKKSTGVESDGMIETVLLFLYYRPMFD